MTQLPPRLSLDLRLSNYTDLLARPGVAGLDRGQPDRGHPGDAVHAAHRGARGLSRWRGSGCPARARDLAVAGVRPDGARDRAWSIPVLLTFRFLGLKDTIAALVIVNVAFWIPLVVWLLRNVFADVPRSLESAARIDGCGRLGTLFRVVLPAAWPGIAATAILLLVGTWNEFLFAVILGDQNAVTVTRLHRLRARPSVPDGPPPFTLVGGRRHHGVRALPGAGDPVLSPPHGWPSQGYVKG